jgi:hypothetical protein
MKEVSLRVIPYQPLRDAARFSGGFALDMNKKDCVYKFSQLSCRQQADASANRSAGPNSRRKANFIQPVIHGHPNAGADCDSLLDPITQKRKREKAVRHGASERRFTLSAPGVQVNPLAVLGGIGEFLDAFLRDDEPVCGREFASFELLQRI